MHDSFAGREQIGCGTLNEAPASGELCTPPERVLFIVDHRCVEVRDPARGAREARESEDHAGEVVNVRVHDVVTPLAQQSIQT